MIVSVQAGIGIGVPRKNNLELFLSTTGLVTCVGVLIETDTHVFLAHITPPSDEHLETRSRIERRRETRGSLIAGVLREALESMQEQADTIIWRMRIKLFVLDERATHEPHFQNVYDEMTRLVSNRNVPVEWLGYDALYVRVRDGAYKSTPPQNTTHKNIYMEGAWDAELREIEPSIRREFGFATDFYDTEMAHKERHIILTRTPAILEENGVTGAWVVDTTY
ncbi:hypothetical protein [Corallococcus llansteffanensis]|uniref:Uncharacterized protein n=1 Tax=Corallococcus llansteffanensis TaxID=2316731 RepID=A0A3A8PJZ6_9BACT|nr:hypothetical protein [Corallococcus llansteffanensis]RKH56598.1 hypothetical protein D7V93_19895 [Corallococcus llansteffanensis]